MDNKQSVDSSYKVSLKRPNSYNLTVTKRHIFFNTLASSSYQPYQNAWNEGQKFLQEAKNNLSSQIDLNNIGQSLKQFQIFLTKARNLALEGEKTFILKTEKIIREHAKDFSSEARTALEKIINQIKNGDQNIDYIALTTTINMLMEEYSDEKSRVHKEYQKTIHEYETTLDRAIKIMQTSTDRDLRKAVRNILEKYNFDQDDIQWRKQAGKGYYGKKAAMLRELEKIFSTHNNKNLITNELETVLIKRALDKIINILRTDSSKLSLLIDFNLTWQANQERIITSIFTWLKDADIYKKTADELAEQYIAEMPALISQIPIDSALVQDYQAISKKQSRSLTTKSLEELFVTPNAITNTQLETMLVEEGLSSLTQLPQLQQELDKLKQSIELLRRDAKTLTPQELVQYNLLIGKKASAESAINGYLTEVRRVILDAIHQMQTTGSYKGPTQTKTAITAYRQALQGQPLKKLIFTNLNKSKLINILQKSLTIKPGKSSAMAELTVGDTIRQAFLNQVSRTKVMGTSITLKYDVVFGLYTDPKAIQLFTNELQQQSQDALLNFTSDFLEKQKERTGGTGRINVHTGVDTYIKHVRSVADQVAKDVQGTDTNKRSKIYTLLHELLTGGISVKNYESAEGKSGFDAGSLGSKKLFENLANLYSYDSTALDQDLMQFILNNSSSTAIAHQLIGPVKAYILGAAALIAFDMGFLHSESALNFIQNQLQGTPMPNVLNLVNVNGRFYPASLVYSSVEQELTNAMQDLNNFASSSGSSTIQITAPSLAMLQNNNKYSSIMHIQKRWDAFAESNQAEVHLYFLTNLASILDRIEEILQKPKV